MFTPMDPEVLYELVKGAPDILTPAVEKDDAIYANSRCPLCGKDGCTKRIEAPLIVETEEGTHMVRTPFGDSLLPHGYAHCGNCSTDFEPHTGVIRKTDASIIGGPQSDPLQG